MAETILTPGKDNSSNIEQTPAISPEYLVKNNYLSEFKTESEKTAARDNLGVLAAESVYTKEEIEPVIVQRISKKLAEHLDSSDHLTLQDILGLLSDLIKNDGTTPFTKPQVGVDPVSNHDLATKIYVDRLIQNCLKASDKTRILDQVAESLIEYVKQESVYTKDEVYTKNQIDNQNAKYIKADGTTPFDRPQSGRTPQLSSHLTTKGYVDNLLQSHKTDIDPHGYTEKLNNKLKKYALKDSVYDRTQTYSRAQIDSVIEKLVSHASEEQFRNHLDLDDPHNILSKVKQLGYVSRDGSTPFKSPQKGVDAISPQDLVTLAQLNKLEENLQANIDKKECEWITSGPSEVTVGNVSANQEFPSTMTLQEVLDAIFYGKGISLLVPEYTNIANTCKVTVSIHGSTGMIEYAELLQDGQIIANFTKEDFDNNKSITVTSNPIYNDSEFTFRVTYINGAIHEETKITKCSIPIFIGTLPKWKFANTVTYSYLQGLCDEDEINNKFYSEGDDISEILHKYDFTGKELKHLFVVVPTKYPDLYQMRIPSQQFDMEAFDIIDMIPLQIPGVPKDIIYKMYVYRQAISSANQETTFKFKK